MDLKNGCDPQDAENAHAGQAYHHGHDGAAYAPQLTHHHIHHPADPVGWQDDRHTNQSGLKHSVEVAQLSGLLASELGYDVRMAKRAGLLHDIGKAVDHEQEGTHVQLGAEICRRYKEPAIVINAVESHHGDVPPTHPISFIVAAADAISASRPGARRESLEAYTQRLKQLEEITNSYKGVEKSFAVQAGREVRIMVKPEEVSEDQMTLLARDIAKKIEDELTYPGQIKVHLLRETKAVDYAK